MKKIIGIIIVLLIFTGCSSGGVRVNKVKRYRVDITSEENIKNNLGPECKKMDVIVKSKGIDTLDRYSYMVYEVSAKNLSDTDIDFVPGLIYSVPVVIDKTKTEKEMGMARPVPPLEIYQIIKNKIEECEREEHLHTPDPVGQFFGAIADITSIGSKDPKVRKENEERRQRNEMDRVIKEGAVRDKMFYKGELERYSNVFLKHTLLKPGEGIVGKVYFNVDTIPDIIKIYVPVEKNRYFFAFKQEKEIWGY